MNVYVPLKVELETRELYVKCFTLPRHDFHSSRTEGGACILDSVNKTSNSNGLSLNSFGQ
jgi:hypothetical protein